MVEQDNGVVDAQDRIERKKKGGGEVEHLLLLVQIPEYENSTCTWPNARPPKHSKQWRGHKARCKKHYTAGNMESSLVWVRYDPIFNICGEVLVVDCKNAVLDLTKLLLDVCGEFDGGFPHER